MAQTTDGFLWLGSMKGLLRFDGVQFEPYKFTNGKSLPSLSVTRLFVDKQKRLWIGSHFGGVSVKDPEGNLRTYGTVDGIPPGTITSIAQDASGTIWVGSSSGLCSFHDGRWKVQTEFIGKAIKSIVSDHNNRIWIGGESGFYAIAADRQALTRRTDAAYRNIQYILISDNKLWISRAKTGVAYLGSVDNPSPPRDVKTGLDEPEVLFDRNGGLWIGGATLLRFPEVRQAMPGMNSVPPSSAQSFTESDGLSGRGVGAMFEDREGNIWVSTSGGLDQFRNNRMVKPENVPMVFPLVQSVAPGQLWVGTRTGITMRIINGIKQTLPALGTNLTAVVAAPDGSFLAATSDGLWRIDGDVITAVSTPVAVSDARQIQSMAYDRRGQLWLSQVRTGLFRLSGGQWLKDPVPGLFPGPAITIHVDIQGRVWLAYPDSQLAMVERNVVRRFDKRDGLVLGNVMSLHSDRRYLWVGGDRGVAEFDGQHFHLLSGNDGVNFQGVTGLMTTADDALWINGSDGVSRIPARQLALARAVPSEHVEYERFDHQDGLPGVAGLLRPLPSVSLASDGHLWFATSSGMSWIDPLHIARNPLAPPLTIRRIRNNNDDYSVRLPARLPAHATELEIDYTALSLSIPERVRFRYRLYGVDADWRDVGSRRTAYYNNLAPGDYRFRVIASNNDGVWNMTGASVDFSIAPAYYQTWWFKLLFFLLSACLLWLVHRLRLRVISARHRTRLEERERIARELHDTLLQSTQGLILEFQGIANGLQVSDLNHGRMNTALHNANSVLVEGRDRVLELRAKQAMDIDLITALQFTCASLNRENTIKWRVIVDGEVKSLNSQAGKEVVNIAREALTNAFRHSQAGLIELRLAYRADALTVTVSDNGIGLPAAVLNSGRSDGHWGLQGMRERAANAGAVLRLESGAGGTSVVLRLTARRAFPIHNGCLHRWRHWRGTTITNQ